MFRRITAIALCAIFALGLGITSLANNQNFNFTQMSSGKSDGKKKIDAGEEQDPYSDFNKKIKKAYEEILKIQKDKEKKYKGEKEKLLKQVEQLNKQKAKLKDTKQLAKLGTEIDKLERQIKQMDQYAELPKMPENKLNDSGNANANPAPAAAEAK